MNSKGQFLLYDILLAVFILFIVLIAVCSVPGQQDDYGIDYSEPGDTLNLLASMKVHDEVLLFALSEDDNDAASMVEGLIDGGYTLKTYRNKNGEVFCVLYYYLLYFEIFLLLLATSFIIS